MEVYIGCLIIFISLVGLSYILINFIREKNIFNVVTERIKESTKNSSDARIKFAQENYKLKGNGEKINFFTKIDIAIEVSGLKKIFKFINTELVLFIISLITMTIGIIVYVLMDDVSLVIVLCLLFLFMMYVLLFIYNNKQTVMIDDSILQFANLMYAYSNVSTDLVTILENVAAQLQEPLKEGVLTAVYESRIDGDVSAALGRLSLKMRHRKLTEMLQALDEGSKNNANYSSILSRCYDSIILYKGEKEVRKNMAKGARFNILLMLGIFMICVFATSSMIGIPINTFFFANSGGKVVFLFCSVIFIYVFWKFISIGTK